MKRWPILVSFILFIGLCVSASFWALQLFKPVARPIVAPKQQATGVDPEAAVDLFGGRPVAAAAISNFQLKGVVVAHNAAESIAIVVADGKPAVAVHVNSEVIPGVKVTEVHTKFILLSEGGAIKRVDLPVAAQQSHPESPVPMQAASQVPPPMSPPMPPPTSATQPMAPPPPQANTIELGLAPQNYQSDADASANASRRTGR
jgi:general secretion pathway protein C